MLSQFMTPDLIESCSQSFTTHIGIVFDLFRPYFIPAIISGILFFAEKRAAKYFYLFLGFSPREAKKKSKQICDGINAVESLYDVYKK